MKQIALTNLGDVKAPRNVVIRVNAIRHDNPQQPFKVTQRRPVDILAKDGPSSYYLGRLPLSEFRTVPHPKKNGETIRQFFSQLEITVAFEGDDAKGINCFAKRFYPRPGSLREIPGFILGKETIFSQRFPIEHLGETANSRVGTDENRNNIYVTICGKSQFVAHAVSIVVQENGVWLVHTPVYTGEVFKDATGIRCPLLEDEKTGGTREAFLPLVKKWFESSPLQSLPDDFVSHQPINVSCLKNGGNATGRWSEAIVHMESPARQLSFGLAKDQETGNARFVYINWEELANALPDKRIKRIPFGSVVKGWIEVDGSGRYKLVRVQFLSKAEAVDRWLTAYQIGKEKGASFQEPEWLQKRKAKLGSEANIGQQFADALDKLLLSIGK